ncbi:50S ribosomal protein L32 [Chlamydiifrater phoenicopteri]|uniref:50S ribosomal protein L32 n=1 Tax=Chlamydiifrater phoenicopteri TaxID=2681469 RepID=UPI001BCBA9E0|nr:50S ribosomal protein L32 [Chlamydiifrater phoenicopteri]
MAVPRNRLSNARKNIRRSHHAKGPRQTAVCKNCKNAFIPHTVCSSCGFYNGRAVLQATEKD